jgi:carboxylesterase 2
MYGFSLLFLVVGVVVSVSSQPTVQVTNGSIVGTTYTWELKTYNWFLGIPFAQAPLRGLRFQNPTPPGKWAIPLQATGFKPGCPQMNDTYSATNMSEDCLYLNVFSPNISTSANLPVMVFIHGGGYVLGAASQYSPKGISKNLASRGVVVVTIQYRLGAFGFFTTGTGDFPPNIGMLDQIAALRWVQAEIKNFGGNPGKVTIFGESAGAASVSILTYSPLAKGLFQQAIMQSGTAYAPWALRGNNGLHYTSSRNLAIASNCTTAAQWDSGQFSNLKACIRGLPWQTIVNLSIMPGDEWKPSVGTMDGLLPSWPRYLNQNRTANMNILLGTNHDEDYFNYLGPIMFGTEKMTMFTQNYFDKQTREYSYGWGQYSAQIETLLQKTYSPSGVSPIAFLSWLRAVISMTSGANQFAPTLREALMAHSISSNVFLYSLDYISSAFPWPKYQNKSVSGVFHSMDIAYVFEQFNSPWSANPTDYAIVNLFGVAWTNFAKTGNPNTPTAPSTTWPSFAPSGGKNPYLSIKSHVPQTMADYHPRANSVWLQQVPNITGSNGPTTPAATTQRPNNICTNRQPCRNNATCQASGSYSYTCICTAGFFGPTCALPSCSITVQNRGAYFLQVQSMGSTGPQQSTIAYGGNVPVTARLNSTLSLSAVFGRSTSCTLTPARCTQKLVTCTGTTLGFSCNNCP